MSTGLSPSSLLTQLQAATAESQQLQEQVQHLQSVIAAKDSEHAELMRVADHVKQQEAARRQAEEKLRMAEQAAEADAAEKDRRYAELYHMVCQVDREVALRREAEKRLEAATAVSRQAVAKASEEALRAKSEADEALARAAASEEARVQVEVRLAEKEASLAPLRSQLAKASQSANENRILSTSLQDQLAVVVKTSEARAAATAEAKARCTAAEERCGAAHKEVEIFSGRITALEKERDDLLEELEASKCENRALQQAYDEAGGALCERYGEANRQRELVESLQKDMQDLEKELADVHLELKATKAENADWCERASVAADQLAQGQSKAVSAFLRKFPAAAALAILFRHILETAADNVEAAVRQRLCLHGSWVSRHEMNNFLTEFLGLRGLELNMVAQALFGTLDLEREGQICQDALLHRLEEPPSMKDVWLADLENIWPGRQEVVRYARRTDRSNSPPRVSLPTARRPRSGSRPGSACAAPGACNRAVRRSSANSADFTGSHAAVLAKGRPHTAGSTRGSRRSQEGFAYTAPAADNLRSRVTGDLPHTEVQDPPWQSTGQRDRKSVV